MITSTSIHSDLPCNLSPHWLSSHLTPTMIMPPWRLARRSNGVMSNTRFSISVILPKFECSRRGAENNLLPLAFALDVAVQRPSDITYSDDDIAKMFAINHIDHVLHFYTCWWRDWQAKQEPYMPWIYNQEFKPIYTLAGEVARPSPEPVDKAVDGIDRQRQKLRTCCGPLLWADILAMIQSTRLNWLSPSNVYYAYALWCVVYPWNCHTLHSAVLHPTFMYPSWFKTRIRLRKARYHFVGRP